jgi:hypothetical protein
MKHVFVAQVAARSLPLGTIMNKLNAIQYNTIKASHAAEDAAGSLPLGASK